MLACQTLLFAFNTVRKRTFYIFCLYASFLEAARRKAEAALVFYDCISGMKKTPCMFGCAPLRQFPGALVQDGKAKMF